MDPEVDSLAEENAEIQVYALVREFLMSYWKRHCTEVLNLKHVMIHDALFGAGSEFTLMSSDLLKALHQVTEVANKELKVQPCNMKVCLYSLVDTILSSVALIQISIVQTTLIHTVFSSDPGYNPFLSENIFLTYAFALFSNPENVGTGTQCVLGHIGHLITNSLMNDYANAFP